MGYRPRGSCPPLLYPGIQGRHWGIYVRGCQSPVRAVEKLFQIRDQCEVRLEDGEEAVKRWWRAGGRSSVTRHRDRPWNPQANWQWRRQRAVGEEQAVSWTGYKNLKCAPFSAICSNHKRKHISLNCVIPLLGIHLGAGEQSKRCDPRFTSQELNSLMMG